MKIQYIGYNTFDDKYFEISDFNNVKSLNKFDINIIDLNSYFLWAKTGIYSNALKIDSYINRLNQIIYESDKNNIFLFLPQQDILNDLNDDISQLGYGIAEKITSITGSRYIYLVSCKTDVSINNTAYYSDFYLRTYSEGREFFESACPGYLMDKTEKFVNEDKDIFAIKLGMEKKNIYITPLIVNNSKEMIQIIYSLLQINESEDYPEWFNEVKMFDDLKQTEYKRQSLEIIEQEKLKIKKVDNILEENNRLKSILYSSGDFLVEVVGEILQNITDYNPKEFKDLKREDFLIDYQGIKLIGEIKGISDNVKNSNIAQLDNHYQTFMETYPDVTAKGILIINYQRQRALDERDPVDQKQIEIAKRNGSLIVPTITLLKIYEKFKVGILTKEKIIEALKTNIGLLRLEDI